MDARARKVDAGQDLLVGSLAAPLPSNRYTQAIRSLLTNCGGTLMERT